MANRACKLNSGARRRGDKLRCNRHAKSGTNIVVSIVKQLLALFQGRSALDGASVCEQMGIQVQLILMILPMLDGGEAPLQGKHCQVEQSNNLSIQGKENGNVQLLVCVVVLR